YNRPGFRRVLETIAEAYRTRRQEIIENAKGFREHLSRPSVQKGSGETIDENLLETAYRAIGSRFDSREGGFGGAPKFPPRMRVARRASRSTSASLKRRWTSSSARCALRMDPSIRHKMRTAKASKESSMCGRWMNFPRSSGMMPNCTPNTSA